MALRCTLRGMMSFSPALQTDMIIAWEAPVAPLMMKKALAAPKASAASIWASRSTDTG